MKDISDCFNNEKNAIFELINIIKEEQNYLIDADIGNLQKLTIKKSEIIRKISGLSNIRLNTLVSIGYEAQNIGLQEWLDNTVDSGVHAIWTEILLLAKAAKELNNTNGLLINKHLTLNKNTLNVLQGALPGEGIYGPDGQSKLHASTRSLVIG